MNRLTDFFKIISDETRLRIILILHQKELCVCEMCEILEESQPKISRHLAKLRDLGIVKDRREGQWIFYLLNIEDPFSLSIIQGIATQKNQFSVIQKDLDRFNSRNDWCVRDKK